MAFLRYKAFLLIILIPAVFIGRAFPGTWGRDFLLVANPEALIIYNSFDQKLDSERKSAFGAYAPFEILGNEKMLSDNFTPVIPVRLLNREYFVMVDETGSPVAGTELPVWQRVQDTRALADTLMVTGTNDLQLVRQDGEQRVLPAGTKVLRVFSLGARYYVRGLAAGSEYGWVDEPYDGWHPAPPKAAEDTGPGADDVSQELARRTLQINHKLDKIYEYLSSESGSSRSAPKLEINRTPQDIFQLSFSGPDAARFANSLLRLEYELSSYLLGSGWRVTQSGGILSIQRNR